MIENGSCCALLAVELAAQKRELTIITNSAFIANYIRGKADLQVVLLGGIYQQDSQVLVGPMIRQGAENFCVTPSLSAQTAILPAPVLPIATSCGLKAVRDMALQAERVIVLTESEKFSRHGIVPLNLKKRNPNGCYGQVCARLRCCLPEAEGTVVITV